MTDILLIEDNKELSTLMRDFLINAGYSCEVCINGEDGLRYLKDNEVRLVVLDIMLPYADGFEICRKIRLTQNIPIIIASARNDKEDKITGLTIGADDYVEKPFDIDILTAKINAIFRRHYNEEQIIKDHNIAIDCLKRVVEIDNVPVTMTGKEFDLLVLLIKNKGKTLTKEWIFDKIWGADSFSEPSTLTVHIKWLRQKIEKDSKNPVRIITVCGVGYRFE